MSDDKEYAIELEKVSKEYPPHGKAGAVSALRDVTVHLRAGTSIAIRGDSGSGKTTLLNLLGGMDSASQGRVVVGGWDLGHLSEPDLCEYRATKVGFVFQTFNLLPELTALENVELPMEAVRTGRSERTARATRLLESVGMGERTRHRPGRLSGGEQQRVAIARALANDPDVILADEPTGNLDQRSRNVVLRLLQTVREKYGTTIVIVTHDPSVAASCEKEYRIKKGNLRWVADHAPVVTSSADDDEEDDDEPSPDDGDRSDR